MYLLCVLSPLLSLAESRKDEGNELYKTRNYNEALEKYSEAIGEDAHTYTHD